MIQTDLQPIERPYLISVRHIRRWNTIGCSRSNGRIPTVAADPTDNGTELMIGHEPNPAVSDARDRSDGCDNLGQPRTACNLGRWVYKRTMCIKSWKDLVRELRLKKVVIEVGVLEHKCNSQNGSAESASSGISVRLPLVSSSLFNFEV